MFYRRVAVEDDDLGESKSGVAGGAARPYVGQEATDQYALDQDCFTDPDEYPEDSGTHHIGFFFEKRFKMLLWDKSKREGGWSIGIKDDYHRKKHDLLDVVTDVIRRIKMLALAKLEDIVGHLIDPHTIRWALTVPTIWGQKRRNHRIWIRGVHRGEIR